MRRLAAFVEALLCFLSAGSGEALAEERANCPRYGFAFDVSEEGVLLQRRVEGPRACAVLCNRSGRGEDGSSLGSLFGAGGCRHFRFDAISGLCSLFNSTPPSTGFQATHVVSGVFPTFTAGAVCASSARLSEWGPWMSLQRAGNSLEPSGIERRSRSVVQPSQFVGEELPHLIEFRRGGPNAASCIQEGIGMLGWGCSERASSLDESGEELRHRNLKSGVAASPSSQRRRVGLASYSFSRERHLAGAESLGASSLEECLGLCRSRSSCTFASFKSEASAAVESGASSKKGLCFLIHGEPGCVFVSRDFASGASPSLKAKRSFLSISLSFSLCLSLPKKAAGFGLGFAASRDSGALRCSFPCEHSEWREWSACSRLCVDGEFQHRVRGVLLPPSNGGSPCKLAEQRPCKASPSYPSAYCGEKTHAAACAFGEWQLWSECSHPCEAGTKTRRRVLLRSSQNTDGSLACGSLLQTRVCNQGIPCSGVCAGGASAFSEWSGCSAVCGGGERRRRRKPEAAFCGLPEEQVETCNEDPCPSALSSSCLYSPWEEWSRCSALCGKGLQTRRRGIIAGEPFSCGELLVDVRECDGPGGDSCGVKLFQTAETLCVGGSGKRRRFSTDAASDAGGAGCTYGEWSSWLPCTPDCKRRRLRLAKENLGSDGGRTPGSVGCAALVEEEPCMEAPCQKGGGFFGLRGKGGAGVADEEEFSSSDKSAVVRAAVLAAFLTLGLVALFIYLRKRGLEYRRLLVDEALWKSGRSHLSETSSEQGCTDTARSDDGASANGGGKEKELSGVEQDEPFWDESSEADEKEALTSKT